MHLSTRCLASHERTVHNSSNLFASPIGPDKDNHSPLLELHAREHVAADMKSAGSASISGFFNTLYFFVGKPIGECN